MMYCSRIHWPFAVEAPVVNYLTSELPLFSEFITFLQNTISYLCNETPGLILFSVRKFYCTSIPFGKGFGFYSTVAET